MTNAVIQACYHDLKFVRTRGVVQIVLEAPIEHAQHVIEVLGTPNPAEEHWVAVARLVAADKVKPQLPKPTENPEGHTAKKHAEACCQDPGFMNWFWSPRVDKSNMVSPPADDREALKEYLGIESMNEFLRDDGVVLAWQALFEEFKFKDTPR